MTIRPKPTPNITAPPSTSPSDRGIACRRCACRHHWVVYSRPRPDGSVARLRECRNCGHQFATRERAIGAAPPPRGPTDLA